MDNYAYQADNDNGNLGRPFAITRYPSRNSRNEYLVEVHSRAKIFKKPGFFKVLSGILLLVAIVFLVGFIIVVVLYTKSKPTICTSDECLRTATNLKFSVDFTVDPCNNFYDFACGRWSEEHPNHGWFSSFSSFTTITERIAISSMDVLTSENNYTKEPAAIQKSRDFYQSCLDLEALDHLGVTSMYPHLKKVGLPIVPSIFSKTVGEKATFSFDWMKTEALIKQVFMSDIFIGAIVDSNVFNGTENVIYLGLSAQDSPLPGPFKKMKVLGSRHWMQLKKEEEDDSYYTNLAKTVDSNIMKYIFKKVVANVTGETPTESKLDEAADIVLNITNKVSDLIGNLTIQEIDEDDIFPITFKELQTRTDRVLLKPQPDFWIRYFKDVFTASNVTVDPKKDLLYVTDVELQYLYRIIPQVAQTPAIQMELFLWWSAAYTMIFSTSSDVVEFIGKQLSSFEHESNHDIARSPSLECALLTNNYMAYAVSYALTDQSFENKTKPRVERLVSELKQAFVDHVSSIQWMDSSTKKATLEKSKEMLTFIGYPDWLFQKGKLDEYYDDVEIKPDTFLNNMMSKIISHSVKKLNSLRDPHKRDWYSEPIEVNAFNSFSDNAINVPMAILSFPVYNLGLEVLNYGSIGAILGHELTHGFDNMGRKHDKYGNHVQWWSNKTIETFDNMTKCFINQYDNFTIKGVDDHVKGEATLGENLADNGGLNQAYTAYKNHVQKYGDEPTLPGFQNFTSAQLFFLAYGSIWCETTTLEDLEDQIKYDEHCPNSVRVLGTLQNSEDFAKAYSCSVGTLMNPQKKCKIW